MNLTIITGNVGKVEEVKTINNSKVLNFTVAVNKTYTKKSNNEKVTQTTWFNCALWSRENVYQYIKTGTHLTITGEIDAKAYLSNEGEAKASLTLDVDTIEFVNKKNAETAE